MSKERIEQVKAFAEKEFAGELVKDPDLLKTLESYIAPVYQVFPGLRADGEGVKVHKGKTVILAEILIYDGTARKTWGETFSRIHTAERGQRYAVVGISAETIRKGQKETVLTFLHELTHAFYKTSNALLFHGLLDGLLIQYERHTGQHIENDYVIPI